MILHLILNSLFVFVLLASTIEFLLFVFQINNLRTRYLCRLLPILKIPFDLLVFTFFDESLWMNLNPFSCEIYVYELLSRFISLPMLDAVVQTHLIIPQYLAAQMPASWLNLL